MLIARVSIAFLLLPPTSTRVTDSTAAAFAPTTAAVHSHPPTPTTVVARNSIYLAAKRQKQKQIVKKNTQAGKGFGRNAILSPTLLTDVAEDDQHHDSSIPPPDPRQQHRVDDDDNDANTAASSTTIHTYLIQWLASHPITRISSKFSIKPSALGGGYGGFANAAISQHDLILQIPRQLCVTHDDVLQDPTCGHVFQSIKNERVGSWGMILLAGWIAKEYVIAQQQQQNMDASSISSSLGSTRSSSNNNRIKHNPYLQSLPWTQGGSFSQDHVLFWSREEVETLLGGSKAYEDAILIRNTVDGAIQRLVDVMVPIILHDIRLGGNHRSSRSEDDHQQLLVSSSSSVSADNAEPDIIRERYIHAAKGAFVIALSRSFAEEVVSDDENDGNSTLETENVLLPLIDILQHSNTPNTILESYDDYILLRARRDIGIGEELYHQYQEERENVIPPHKFFTRYGFTPGVNEPIAELLKRRSDLFF